MTFNNTKEALDHILLRNEIEKFIQIEFYPLLQNNIKAEFTLCSKLGWFNIEVYLPKKKEITELQERIGKLFKKHLGEDCWFDRWTFTDL